MQKFRKGDRVQRINDDNGVFKKGMYGTVINPSGVDVKVDGTNGYVESGNDQDNLILINQSAPNMNLKEKFAIAFKGEPEKSFIKAGVMNVDESLTEDGQALFLAYLLQKEGNAFKTEIVDPILAEQDK